MFVLFDKKNENYRIRRMFNIINKTMYWKLNLPEIPTKDDSMLCDYVIYISHHTETTRVYELFATTTDPVSKISEWERKTKAHGIRLHMVILMNNGQNFVNKYRRKEYNVDEILQEHRQYIIGGYKDFGRPIAELLPVPAPAPLPDVAKTNDFPTSPLPKPKSLPVSGKLYILLDKWTEVTIVEATGKNYKFTTPDNQTVIKSLRITYYRKDWYL